MEYMQTQLQDMNERIYRPVYEWAWEKDKKIKAL